MTKTVKSAAKKGANHGAGGRKRTAEPAKQPEDKPENRDVGETAAAIADPGDHGRLLMVNAAVFGLGLITRNARLMRTGVRMAIAQGLAFGTRTLFTQGLHAQGEESAEEASDNGASRTGASGEDGVATGSGAATVAVARAVSATTPIPYIPARLAGLAVTGRNTPRKANAVSDFLMGSAIGWIAERLASRLIGSGKSSEDDET